MQATNDVTVREIAANSLAAVRIFEKYGIDYCCGGKRPLHEVCRDKGYDFETLESELDAAMSAQPAAACDWSVAPLRGLIAHIVTTHHEYLRRELPAIHTRLEKVLRVYNQRYGPTLIGLPEVFSELRTELAIHIRKEEMVLFPTIAVYETAIRSGQPLPSMPFGPVSNPIQMMEEEHERAGEALAKIRRITRDFEVPDCACVTYRALMSGLDELERDLHMHIHLENNILFPRAQKLEFSQG